jgi:hypothetical protein
VSVLRVICKVCGRKVSARHERNSVFVFPEAHKNRKIKRWCTGSSYEVEILAKQGKVVA